MKYVGIDLHKKQTISGCVIVKEHGRKKVFVRKRLECRDEAAIAAWLKELGPFEVVVEATASYQWFVKLAEPLARRVLLAHPKKLRIIAESKRKSDKLDAQVLAEFLASDEIPLSFSAGPRPPHAGALPALPPAPDHGREEQAASPSGPVQRRRAAPVHARGPAASGHGETLGGGPLRGGRTGLRNPPP